MKKNIVTKIYPMSGITWTAPAGVTQVSVTILDKLDNLCKAGSFGNSYGLRRTGAAYSWGGNTYGELGDGTVVAKSSPVPVSGGQSFIQLAAAYQYACGLRADGVAYAWGRNDGGQLGDGTIVSKSVPVLVTGSHSFIQISAGGSNTAGLKVDGSVWAWGANSAGQLGDNTIAAKSSPVQVTGGHSFIQISVCNNGSTLANSSICALKSDGSVWSWGLNTNGQLGDNTTVNKSSPVAVVGGHSFVQVAMGTNHVVALKSNGQVWTWGQNNAGQLGNGLSDLTGLENKSSPIQVIGGHSFVQVSAGLLTSAALKADGSAWTWGNNANLALGDGTGVSQSSPVAVAGGHSFVYVSAGGNNNMTAVKANGELWGWGASTGDGTTIPRISPVKVAGTFTFEAGVQYTNRRVFTVVPGTSYSISSFFTSIGSQVMISNAQNNSYIVLEYYG